MNPAQPDEAPAPGLSHPLVHGLLFALAYFAGSELGYALSLGPSVGGTFWPPAGISLAVFLASPTRSWPLLLAAGVIANSASDVLHGQQLAASAGFVLANLGEPLIGALLLRRIVAAPIAFARYHEMVALAIVVVLVSAPLAAVIGAATAELFTPSPPGFAAGWRTWWVGDAVGALVLTPLVVRVIAQWRRVRSVPAHIWLEASAFTIAVWAVTDIVFSAPPTSLAMPFLVFPVLLWGSVRLGAIAVGGALCLIVVLTTHDTAAGQGPFAAQHLSLGERLVALQIYVGVMALSFHGLGVLWDERARTAAALKLAHSGLEARHRRIVEQSPLAILAVQPGGRVQEVNPAWRRLRASEGDATAATPQPLDPELKPLLARAFAGEIVELPERELVVHGAKESAIRRVRGFAYPIKDDTRSVSEVVVIERDFTDEIAAQQQLVEANRRLREREEALSEALRQMADAHAHREQLLEAERFARSEAERASQLKDEFLATLSHELRTPLNAIVGWAHILRRSSRDPALAQAVETIERNARAQTKLIDDLLDMSRIVAGKLGLTLVPTSLAELVTNAADALQPVARAKGVTLSIAVDEGADAWVSCDAERVQQVITNLLGNGIKFTPAGGLVEARVRVAAGDAELVVRDTGEGIEPDFLPVVFERFRQADGSITRRHGGLGLGLSIARQIVEMHGGSIRAHSDGRGLGAVFLVTLPLIAAGSGSEKSPDDRWEPVSPSLTRVRVLVVDDDADARELLRRLLLDQGCDVSCACSAEEALQALAARPYDVLLTDLGMPGADGYELLTRIRTGDYPQPQAIAVTAFARPEDRERALATGFDGHLAKPVSPPQLLQALERLVRSAQPDRHDPATAPTRSDAEALPS